MKKYTVCHRRMVNERTWWTIEAKSEEEALERFQYEGDCVDTDMEFDMPEDGSSTVVKVEEIKE